MKAIFKIFGHDCYYIVQGVEELYDIVPIPLSNDLESKFGFGKIIFIGPNIKFDELEVSFKKLN